MYKLALYQHTDDIKKVSFTRFLKEEKKLSLSEAKDALDKFLEGIPLLFLFHSKTELQQFKMKAEALGAIAKVLTSRLFIESSAIETKQSVKKTPCKSVKTQKRKNEFSEVLMIK